MTALEIIPVTGIPEVQPGDQIAGLITSHVDLRDNDVVIVTSKIVSKSEGRLRDCNNDDLAAREALIRSESRRILRRRGDLFIAETPHGFVCANAGVDWSNSAPGRAVLLPERPDKSAHDIRNAIRGSGGLSVAVVITDSFGRTWRNGTVNVAIGCAGIVALNDRRGTVDDHGNTLTNTQICTVDELAAAASLVMGKTSAIPVAVIRGIDPPLLGTGSVNGEVIRKPELDLFR